MTVTTNPIVNGDPGPGGGGGGGGGDGSVTSVGFTAPAFYSVAGVPITTAGTITMDYSGAGQAEMRTAMGLGTAATLDSDSDPTLAANSNARLPTQAAVFAYIGNQLAGLQYKSAVRVAVTTNGALATAYQNGASAGGVTLATGDRIALMGQTAGAENGLRTVAATGVPPRATDADTGAEMVSATFTVSAGTLAGTLWTCNTPGPITLDTTPLTFAQLPSAGTYTADNTTLQLAGTQFSIKALGVGTAQLAASSVTYGKLQNVSATNRVLGRDTAGAGPVEEMSMSGSGAIARVNGANFTAPALGTPSALVLANATGLTVQGGGTGRALATAFAPVCGGATDTGAHQSAGIGTAGQVFTSGGPGVLPSFQTPPSTAVPNAAFYYGTVASTAALTGLTAAVKGSRADVGAGVLYELMTTDPTVEANWQQIQGTLSSGTAASITLLPGQFPRQLVVWVASGTQVTVGDGTSSYVLYESTYPHVFTLYEKPGVTDPTTITVQRTSGSATTGVWSLERV